MMKNPNLILKTGHQQSVPPPVPLRKTSDGIVMGTRNLHSRKTSQDEKSIQETSFNLQDPKSIDNGLAKPIDDEEIKLKLYHEQLLIKKQIEIKNAVEQEFLRSSLRGSKKLQSLETTKPSQKFQHTNEAFEHESSLNSCDKSDPKTSEVHILDEQVQNMLLDKELNQPITLNACQKLDNVKNVLESLSNKVDALELLHTFQKPSIHGVITAHDLTAAQQNMPSPSTSRTFSDVCMLEEDYSHPDFLGFKETSFDGHPTSINLRVIKMIKDGDLPLGATVKNEGDSIIVSRIIKGGVADKSGLLKEGDELIDVNGNDLRGRSVHDVCDILAQMSGELTFVISPGPPETFIDSVLPQNVIKHVRALFNYDPDEDPYLPCRELGLNFSKGDILHIICMNDRNWWQALRDGEENVQQLAGLVPSAELQTQKEKYFRETGVGNFSSINDEKNGSLLICTRGMKIKTLTRRKKLNPKDQPSDSELFIPTYEDVCLYLSPTGQRRPLILVGPPNVGCLELRQKLIESEKDTFSGVVPHTTRPKRIDEQDGIHFHFLTRPQFQDEVNTGNFVEWGEFQKHLYGTSIDSIRKVMLKGKTCVLTLKVQSIKNIRTEDFMPFVVFVSPPSLERMKLSKRKMGAKDVKEDELKSIIYEARELEDQFGHLFDKVLINYDLDRSYQELRTMLHRLDTEPQWVPAQWLKDPNNSLSRY